MQLSKEQAYLAMYHFLNKQFSLGWEELGGILGSMSLLPDGGSVDPAFVSDWNEAVEAATSGKVNAQLTFIS
ncbi:MAG: hypothetical protein LBV44_00045 [Methylobacillus sp.]|nr:hypothetical protein [Methylobacillus sp.]